MNREIKQFTLGPVSTNCYVFINSNTKECFVVDPADKPDTFIQSFAVEGLKLTAILLTHGHFDHISGVEALVEKYNIPVYAMDSEVDLIGNKDLNLSTRFGHDVMWNKTIGLKDGEEIILADFSVKVIATPGHTIGGACYYIENEGVIFTGDTLFAGCIGRTDFPTGDTQTLKKSVNEKLYTLPEDTIVYPGHMEATTIGHEKQHNRLS